MWLSFWAACIPTAGKPGNGCGASRLPFQVQPQNRLNHLTNRVEITTQNHGFAVRLDRLPRDLEPTHVNLNDQTLEGMRHRKYPLFSVQYHPEASAGPHDSGYLFEDFVRMMG